jgi:hypothetical protein
LIKLAELSLKTEQEKTAQATAQAAAEEVKAKAAAEEVKAKAAAEEVKAKAAAEEVKAVERTKQEIERTKQEEAKWKAATAASSLQRGRDLALRVIIDSGVFVFLMVLFLAQVVSPIQ